MWAYARSAFDALPGVAYDFCLGRGGKYAARFLGNWSGTLVRDEFSGYESVVKLHDPKAAGCLAHARRKFGERQAACPVKRHSGWPVGRG